MSTPKQSHSAYQSTIVGDLGQLEYLVKHSADGEEITWEHVGQLSELKDRLAELLAFMKGVE